MGQTQGRAPVVPVARHFVNLPWRSVHELWAAFNDVAEGFGLTKEEMTEILRVVLKDVLGYTEKKLDSLSRQLFQLLDDDKNDLADALEFLSALAAVSGASNREKMEFVFGLYDFDESGVLTVDEMILALRSTVSGLAKLSGIDMPEEADVERVAVGAFENAKSIDGSTVDKADFCTYCASTPEIVSWMDFYADLQEPVRVPLDAAGDPHSADARVLVEARVADRTKNHAAFMDDDGGQFFRIHSGRDTTQQQLLPPWKTIVPFIAPTKKSTQQQQQGLTDSSSLAAEGTEASDRNRQNQPPACCLKLEFVHGFNCQKRQNVLYTARGELVYPAGTVGVVFDVANRKQRLFNGHTDLIECLRTFEMGSETLVATGQAGMVPKICVWSSTSGDLLSTMRGVHRASVNHVDVHGDRLVAVGGPAGAGVDKAAGQTVAVYRWRHAELLFSATVPSSHFILDARFLSTELEFATCGVDHVHFWRQSSGGNNRGEKEQALGATTTKDSAVVVGGGCCAYRRDAGLFCNRVAVQPVLCVCAIRENLQPTTARRVVAGTATGHLLEWAGRTCVSSKKAHAAEIRCLVPVPEKHFKEGLGLASGSADGVVHLWTTELQLGQTIHLNAVGPLSTGLVSLAWDAQRGKIAAATDAGEIYELSAKEGFGLHQDGPVIVGHSERRLSALAAHPENKDLLATVGDDFRVHVWSASKKRSIKSTQLDAMARCCAFSKDGSLLAVGLGGVQHDGKRGRKDGAFAILNSTDLSVIHEARDSKQPITCASFSPDGLTLVIGSDDKLLYLYNVGDFASTTKCRGHKGRVMQVDWSSDSKFLQSADDQGELLFWDADSGEQRPPRFMKDTQWATHSSVFGYPMQAAWGDLDSSGFLVSASVSASKDDDLLATMDNFGRLRVWNFPSTPIPRTYHCHAAPGGTVTFTKDGSTLFTTGRGDGVVAQWSVRKPADREQAPESKDRHEPEEALDYVSGSKLDKPSWLNAALTFDKTAVFRMEERGKDTDFAPVRPWQRTVVAPSRPPLENNSVPSDKLELEWVHGVRCHDVRGHVWLNPDSGDVVFPAGTMVVSLSPHERRQRFYKEHAFEVVSLTGHAERGVGASGDSGAYPSVHVWDSNSLKQLQVLKNYHRRSVLLLAFSPDERAKYLVSLGADDFHTAVVFDWANGVVACRTPTQKMRPLGLTFARQGSTGFGASSCGFVLSGEHFVQFWDLSAGRNAETQSCRLGVKGRLQPFLCVAWVGSNLVAGALDGSLYRFSGRHLDKTLSAHKGAIHCVHSTNEGLATGGRDGFVKLWSASLELKLVVDVQELGSKNPVVRSVSWDNERRRLALATLAAEIWQVDSSDGVNAHGGAPLIQGHFDGELWGLATHPTLPQFATTGDDALLRIWSLFEKRQVRVHALEMASRACAYSPDGKKIAIGYGAPTKSKLKQFDGKFVVLDTDDFSVLHETRDTQKWITEIKYAPSGELIAVGSWDTRIYVYAFDGGDLKLQHMITQHNAHVTHLDFSVQGNIQYLQSNCGAYELCFFEADTGMYIPAASRLKDVKWASSTCPLTWASQGAWPAENDGVDVTACDCSTASPQVRALACGDNFGRIRLYRYPATSSKAKAKEYRGHAADVTKVRWAGGDSHLLTTSAKDRCVFQWAHVVDDVAADEFATFLQSQPDDGDDAGVNNTAAGVNAAKGGPETARRIDALLDDDEEETDEENDTDGKKKVQSMQWLLGAVAPSNPPKANLNPPSADIRLEWVHGSDAELARSSVAYTASGEIAYPAGKVGVVYSPRSHSQNLYRDHSNCLSALAASPTGRYLASGEVADRPIVRVWDSGACVTAVEFSPAFHRHRVRLLQFAPDGKRLISVGCDDDGSIAVWRSPSGEWFDGYLQVGVAGADRPVHFACFAALETQAANPASSYEGYELCSGGQGHVYFWQLDGTTLASTEALWAAGDRTQTFLCGASVLDRFVTGGSLGQLYVWKLRTCEKILKAHDAAVESIHAAPGEAGFATGGRDGLIKLWSSRLRHVKTFDIREAYVPPLDPCVLSVHVGLAENKIVRIAVGCASSEIYEVAKESGSLALLAEGHFKDELWVVAAHPTDPDVYATAGDDHTIRVWSISQHRLLRKALLDGPVRALAWSPDGGRFLAGMGGTAAGVRHPKDGVFLLLNAHTLQVIHEGRDSRYWIRVAKFAPDGSKFALGAMDAKIYVYDSNSTQLLFKCAKHNSFVTHLDFSTDSNFIQSDAADYEHLYHDLSDGSHVRLPSQLKDAVWHDWSCVYGWPVQGCWPSLSGDKGRDPRVNVAAVARSPDGALLAAGDEKGRLRFLRYPSLQKQLSLPCDHSHVDTLASLAFTADGSHLITVGKHDRTAAVWRVDPHQKPPTADPDDS